jgi:hypothetical protein
MPRRERLSPVQRAALVGIPTDREGLALRYTLGADDRALVSSKRSDRNQLGFTVQLAIFRYPGQALTPETEPPAELVTFLARQLDVPSAAWADYATRDETRREHALELQAALGLNAFTVPEYRARRRWLTELALRTHQPMALAEQLIERLRADRIIVPSIQVIDRLCGEAIARGTRQLYQLLTDPLDDGARERLDALLLPVGDTRTLVLTQILQPPGEAKPGPILRHLSRLTRLRELALPPDLARRVHQGRLAELAREGAQMSIQCPSGDRA